MLSLTMHLQSVILQYRYRYNHIIKSCRPIRFISWFDQPIVRSLCCTLHAPFSGKTVDKHKYLSLRVYQTLQATVPHTSYSGHK